MRSTVAASMVAVRGAAHAARKTSGARDHRLILIVPSWPRGMHGPNLGSRQVTGVERADAACVLAIVGEQSSARRAAVIAGAARQLVELGGIVGDLLDRSIVDDAQPVLEAAQKRVGLGERRRLRGLEHAGLGEPRDRLR